MHDFLVYGLFKVIKRRLTQINFLLRKIVKLALSPRDFYHLILAATSGPPKISIQKSKHGIFCGLENDNLFNISSVRLKSEQIQLVRADRCFREDGIGLQGA